MRSKFKWIYALLVAITMQFSFAQEKTVTGTVSDNLGVLPGVNVSVKGSTRRVSTDFDGKYAIKAKEGEVLVFSFVEMANAEKTVGASSVVNVSMKSTGLLNEVIVGALGIKKSKDSQTSNQQLVKARELTQAVNPSVIQSLAAKVSGLQINTTSNGVNASTKIILRGYRSLTGNSEALVVIDNAISSATVLGQLAPETVETINVIKGQQGAALYGELGSNGVIIVTTKKGSGNKDGKAVITFSSSIDLENVNFVASRQAEYGQGWGTDPNFHDGSGINNNHVAFENGSWGPSFNDPKFKGTLQPTGLPQADGHFIYAPWAPVKDNVKNFFKTGTLIQTGINFSLGDDNGYVSFAYNRTNTDYLVQGDKLNRNSFTVKGGKKIGKFNVDASVNYINQNTSETENGLYDALLQGATNIPFDQFSGGEQQHHWTAYALSPYFQIKNIRYDNSSDILNGSASVGYKFNNNISLTNTANIAYRVNDNKYHNNGFNQDYVYNFDAPYDYAGNSTPAFSDLGSFVGSSFYNGVTTRRDIYNDLLLNFDYKLTKDLGLKFNIGGNITDNNFSVGTIGGTGLNKPNLYNINNVLVPGNVNFAGADDSTPSPFVDFTTRKLDNRIVRNRRVAQFGNFDFAFKDYLFLNATYRLEKSSVVKNAQFYPSLGVSFVPTKAFEVLKDGKVLNYLKFAASYVITGNASNVRPYETYGAPGVLATGSSTSYVYPAAIIDPNIKPEFITTKEFDANLGFFNDRFTIDFSIYQSDTKNLINNSTISNTSGSTALKTNIGSLRNTGFELDLGITPLKSANFSWKLRGSISKYDTKVLSLADGAPELVLGGGAGITRGGAAIYAVVGESFPVIKGTAYQRDPNGNIIVGSDGVPLTTPDLKILGKVAPDYILGFTNTFEYKTWRLTAVLDYRTGNSVYSEAIDRLAFTGGLEASAGYDRFAAPYIVPGSVQQTSPGVFVTNTTGVLAGTAIGGGLNTNNGRVTNYFGNVYNRVSENMIVDATALKVREIALSFGLPQKYASSLGIQSMRFGINARNPFVILAKNNRGYTDPEASSATAGSGFNANATGISQIGQYPSTRTVGFSVNVTF